ncbi:glutaredoxin family protein [Pseudazoarcus pumilus]|uniref:Thioredoxin family protein n=1 Tax=Pseudazoarcus pumilus TaxID=2067960 RepID=A0A2I6S551_9RHOO|nr:glutaredoxin family protein [Pseudazoarcus pumilus]AUN94377.1 thioredoxin family protein [Pseudazoarcus pumilus]
MSAREFIVLGRQWCHLCDDMTAALRPLAAEFGWSVRVLDVDADPALEAKWDELVPVLLADGRELCHYHLDEAAVRAHVAEFG